MSDREIEDLRAEVAELRQRIKLFRSTMGECMRDILSGFEPVVLEAVERRIFQAVERGLFRAMEQRFEPRAAKETLTCKKFEGRFLVAQPPRSGIVREYCSHATAAQYHTKSF